MKKSHKFIMGAVLAVAVLIVPKACFAEGISSNNITKYNYNGNLYSVLDNEDLKCKSLDEMKSYAESLGGHLVYINDAEENEFVWKIIREKNSKSSYVLGMYRDKDSREWKYDDGQNVKYTNWAPGEPNRDDEDYAHIYTKNGKWNNTINVPKAPEDSIYRLSDMGMVIEWEGQYKLNNHSYSIVENADVKSLEDMKRYAESLGGHLAYINDAEENEFIWKIIREEGSKSSYVLGMYRDKDSREWKYDNGQNVEYTNWAPGEPNRDDEDYAHIYKKNGKWNNTVNVPRAPEDSIYRLSDMGMIIEWD